MFFEEWIHNKIRKTFKKNPEYRKFTGKENLQEINRQDVEKFQCFNLNKILEYASSQSVFYRGLYQKVGTINTLADLGNIPFTQPDDIRYHPYKLLCVSQSQIKRTFSHFTTGTTGRPKKIFFTQKDADAIVDSKAAIMKTVMSEAGMDMRGQSVHIFLPDNVTPLSMARLIARGVEKLGGVPVIGDCYCPTEEKIQSIIKTRPVMIMGSAFRIWRMTQEGRLIHNLKSIGVKAVFITSEYLAVPARKYLETCWGAEIFHHYGMTEAGFAIGIECHAHDGYHFNECDLLFETVDPETSEMLTNEEEGELVFTTLNREGMPLIRYRTGDIARIIRTPCKCGANTVLKIGQIPKRKALIVEIGNKRKIFTSMVDDALYAVPELVDYRLFITKKNSKDAICCHAEVLENSTGVEQQIIQRLISIAPIKESIGSKMLGMPEIKFAEKGTLRRGGRTQKRRIVDNR
ncbi:MAG: DVU_1553 family AMP-dependent CoA ligase [Thermodesulfobacteriota bacterium]